MLLLLGFLALAFGVGLVADRIGTEESGMLLAASVAVAAVYYLFPRVM